MDLHFDKSLLYLAELNPDQKEPLTEYCLEQYDCECHPNVPEFVWPGSPWESEHASSASYQSETMSHRDITDMIVAYPKDQGGARDWQTVKTAAAPPNDKLPRLIPTQDSSPAPRVSARLREKRKQKEPSGESISASVRKSRAPRSRTKCSNPRPGQTLPSALSVHGNPSHSTQELQPNVVVNERRYACDWKKWFGGTCSRVLDDPYQHDMHVVTHLRDKEGHAFAVYKCMACHQRFVHLKACQRHARAVHKHDAELVELVSPGIVMLATRKRSLERFVHERVLENGLPQQRYLNDLRSVGSRPE